MGHSKYIYQVLNKYNLVDNKYNVIVVVIQFLATTNTYIKFWTNLILKLFNALSAAKTVLKLVLKIGFNLPRDI